MKSDNAIVDNDRERREREAREAQEKQQTVTNTEQWCNWIDQRIDQRLAHHAGSRAHTTEDRLIDDGLPDILRDALGQVLAEQRRQWRREYAAMEAQARQTVAELRATIAELSNEIRQKAAEAKPVAGPPGERGPEGRPGRLPIARRYEPSVVYYEGDCVVHDGSLYQATRDTGRAVTHPDWICLARAGRDGRDGTTPTVRGTYDLHEAYSQLDIVAMDGASFIAKYDNPGICPGTGWQLMSHQGRSGRKGETGERGPRGEQGETGPPAVVPQFVGSRINENYELVRVLSDGSREVMTLRPAFERFFDEVSSQ